MILKLKTSKLNLFFGMFLIVSLLSSLVIPSNTEGSSATEQAKLRQELQQKMNELQQQIQEYQRNIQNNQSKAQSLKNEISILEDGISKIHLQIEEIDLAIQESELSIGEAEKEIQNIENRIGTEKKTLAEYLRAINRCDQENLLEIMLKKDNLSDFFNEVNALESVQFKIHETLDRIRQSKEDLEKEKSVLEDERDEKYRLKSSQVLQRRSVEMKQQQKENILRETRGQEELYQEKIVENEEDIEYIKEQLSLLDKYNITLDDAINNAILAATKTGIRPAFLLGVLEAESRLGQNLGSGNWREDMYQCYRKIGYVTRAEKEKNAFLQICQELGLNPDTQPVSGEPYYGCGGALGVAQFMPTTWLAYKDQVASLTGHNPPSPWRPVDAFMAAAIKLANGGANSREEVGERTAYAKYLAGGYYKKWMYRAETNKVISLTNSFHQQYFAN